MAVRITSFRHPELIVIDAAVRETMGDDAPDECYEVAREILADEILHQKMLRALDNYRRPLDRAAALAEAVATIKAC